MLSLFCLAFETAAAAAVFAPATTQQSAPPVRDARARRYGQIQTLFAGAGPDYPPAQVLLRL